MMVLLLWARRTDHSGCFIPELYFFFFNLVDYIEQWSLLLGICQQAWKQYLCKACFASRTTEQEEPWVTQMGTLWSDAACWKPSSSMMLGLDVPYLWHISLPKPNDEDQLFSPLLHGSSGKAWGTVSYIRSLEFCSLGEIDPWEELVPSLFSCAFLFLLLWLLCFSQGRAHRSSKLCSDNWLCSSFMPLFSGI